MRHVGATSESSVVTSAERNGIVTPRSVRKHAQKLKRRMGRIGFTTPWVFVFIYLMMGWVGAKSAVTLVIDGHSRQKETTAETVREFLSRNRVRLRKEDLVSPAPSSLIESGAKVVVRRAVPVTVRIEGQDKKILTAARTVSEALSFGGIRIEPGDRADTPLSSAVTSGMIVSITKQTVKEETVSQSAPFKVIKQRDDTLELGKIVVERQGRPGLVERIFRVTYLGSQEIARELKMEAVRVRPLAKVIRFGTMRTIIPMRGQGESERPLPEGSQPPSQSQDGVASYYTLHGKGVGMTAAHRSLPFGTKVRVTNLTSSKQVEVVINDRGPFRQGRIIDLATDAFRAIASTSQGVCRVRIEW